MKAKLNKYQIELNENGLESCLELLATDGYCPNLINDDNGSWALAFDGYQSLRMNKSDDLTTTFMIDAKAFKPTIIKAVKFQLKDFTIN